VYIILRFDEFVSYWELCRTLWIFSAFSRTNFHSANFRIKRKIKDLFQTNISASMLIRANAVKVKQTGQ